MVCLGKCFVLRRKKWQEFGDEYAMRSFIYLKIKSKGKDHLHDCFYKHRGEAKYNSNPSATSALEGGGWMGVERHVATALQLRNTRYPLCSRLFGLRGCPGRGRKISLPPGFDLRTLRPVASRCINCTIPVSFFINCPYPMLLGP